MLSKSLHILDQDTSGKSAAGVGLLVLPQIGLETQLIIIRLSYPAEGSRSATFQLGLPCPCEGACVE